MSVPFREALKFWAKLGFISFGGPAGQIALMHTDLVERQRWISEQRFLHALNYCMLLPGPEAMQLAVYIGWLMHRSIGGQGPAVARAGPRGVTNMRTNDDHSQTVAQSLTAYASPAHGMRRHAPSRTRNTPCTRWALLPPLSGKGAASRAAAYLASFLEYLNLSD